ncbi:MULTISPECIES: hypothetical protein [unclassified Streptomyces]|uniref:hypothetical protein n=1 Tax=unclassified Streptomyces TaxID=2593676 RepID=UPI0011B0D53F|nr:MULTISPECIES: hypothetical protein [unclassified Streptomyces]
MSFRSRVKSPLLPAVCLAATVLVASGCSSGNATSDDGRSDGTASVEPDHASAGSPEADDSDAAADPDDSADPDGRDRADLESLYAAYWRAMVELENADVMPGPELFDGITASELLERQMARVEQLKRSGHARAGEPVVERVSVEVRGDEAIIQACVDESGWELRREGEPVPVTDAGPSPRVMAADLTPQGWRLARTEPVESATITC